MNISRIYCPYIKNQSLIIVKNNRFNYIKNVLRKRINDKLIIFNGLGTESYAYLKYVKKKYLVIEIEKEYTNTPSNFFFNVALPLIKKKKFEFVMEKANEMGVFSLTPLITDFTAKNYLNNDKKKMMHLEKKIISSAEQNGRNQLMILNKVKTIKEFCIEINPINAVKVYLQPFSENEFLDIFCILKQHQKSNSIKKNKIFIVVGPEGGFSREEIILLNKCNFIGYHLTNNILCSETSVISSIAILSNILRYFKICK